MSFWGSTSGYDGVATGERAARENSRPMPEDGPVINQVFGIPLVVLFLVGGDINVQADGNPNG